MPRVLARFFRKAIKVSIASIALANFTAPAVVGQQPKIVIKSVETNRISASGDGQFRGELTLPEAGYEMLKKAVPDASVMLRKLGLKNEESIVDGVQGEWIDDSHMLKVQFSARGIARMGKDGAWSIAIADGIETKFLGFTDGVAELEQSMPIPGVGLATSKGRVTLPKGATDVKLSRDKTRLTYKLPEPISNGQTTKVEFDVDAKKHILGSLAKVTSNRKFASLWVTRSVFKNSGETVLKDYRVRFRMADFTNAWSPWAGSPLVVPGQTIVDAYHPVMDIEKIAKLTGQTKVAVEIQWQYTRPDGKVVEDTDTKELTLLSRNQVQYSSMRIEDCTDWTDAFDQSAIVMATFVTHEDPVIQQAAGRICKAIGGNDASLSDEAAIKFLAAAYDFMAANIAYQTSPFRIDDDKAMQHVKYGRDVLKNKAGTCIDLAILYASLCEAVGLKPVLFNIPGHCFPGIYLPKSGKLITVEATKIGNGSFLDAVNFSTEPNMKPIQEGKKPVVPANILQLHSLGIHPIDLPALPDDVLEKWGITFLLQGMAEAPKPMPKTEVNANVPVGLWQTTYRIGNVNVVQVTGIDEDGSIASKAETDNGLTIVRKGKFVMKGKKMTITLTDDTVHSGTIEIKGKDGFIFHADSGESLTYTRINK